MAKKTYTLSHSTPGYYTAIDAKRELNANSTVKAGKYYVYNTSGGMINIASKLGQAGWWINTNSSTGKQPAAANTSKGNGTNGNNTLVPSNTGSFVNAAAGNYNSDINYTANKHYVKQTKNGVLLYITNLVTNNTMSFDVTPDEFTDSNSSGFDNENIRGRSTPIWGYNSSGPRTASLNLNLYDDYLYYGIQNTVRFLRALEYPSYTQGIVTPPSAHMRYGDMFAAKVIVTQVDITWSGPYKSGHNINAQASLSFTEVVDTPYSVGQIERGEDFVL